MAGLADLARRKLVVLGRLGRSLDQQSSSRDQCDRRFFRNSTACQQHRNRPGSHQSRVTTISSSLILPLGSVLWIMRTVSFTFFAKFFTLAAGRVPRYPSLAPQTDETFFSDVSGSALLTPLGRRCGRCYSVHFCCGRRFASLVFKGFRHSARLGGISAPRLKSATGRSGATQDLHLPERRVFRTHHGITLPSPFVTIATDPCKNITVNNVCMSPILTSQRNANIIWSQNYEFALRVPSRWSSGETTRRLYGAMARRRIGAAAPSRLGSE